MAILQAVVRARGAAPASPPSVLFSTAKGAAGADSTTTDSATTPTNATFIVCVTWQDNQTPAPTITDSKGNTYTQQGTTAVPSGGTVSEYCAIFRCNNGTGGASHTFTASKTGGFTSIIVIAVEPTASINGTLLTTTVTGTNSASPNINVTQPALLLSFLGYESTTNSLTSHNPVAPAVTVAELTNPSFWQCLVMRRTLNSGDVPNFYNNSVNITGDTFASGAHFSIVVTF